MLQNIIARQPLEAGPFLQQWRATDLEALQDFFHHGAQRLRNLKESLTLGDAVIAPEELDDLLVMRKSQPLAKASSGASPA